MISIIYTNTKATISNLNVTGRYDSVIDVDTNAELALTGNTSITNNVLTSGYAIELDGTLYVEGNVQINNNNTADSASIFVRPNGVITNVAGKKIATTSKISVSALNNNKTVFKYWNEYSFEDFKNNNTMNDPSNIFLLDNNTKALGHRVYKKGTYSNVELAVGDD